MNEIFHNKNEKKKKSLLKEGIMKKSRLITTIILVFMITMVMGVSDAEAQTPSACATNQNTNGWISMPASSTAIITGSDDPGPAISAQSEDFIYNAGLLGTVENFQGQVIAGLDWLYDDREPNLETNMVGTQLVSWWTQKNGRSTLLQATNTNTRDMIIGDEIPGQPGFPQGSVTVHVQILGEDCVELRNFCDTLHTSRYCSV